MSDNHDLLNDNDMCSFSGHEAEDMCFNCGDHTCGDGSIDVKGQGLRGEQSLILSHSCTPDHFVKGWFNQEKTLWGNLSNELFYRVETRD